MLIDSEDCDEHQCTLEFVGDVWRLRQGSKSHPTFVNGQLNSYARLKPGAEVTFLDGSGFTLQKMKRRPQRSFLPQISGRVIAASVAVGLVILAGLMYTAWKFLG